MFVVKHGIDQSRILNPDKLLPELTCELCSLILHCPTNCAECESSFCRDCLTDYRAVKKDNGATCPKGCIAQERKPHMIILNLLSNLQVTCAFKQNGCKEVINHKELESHEAQCGFKQVACQGCEVMLLATEIKEHEHSCDLIKVQCEKCLTILTRKEQKESHNEINCLNSKVIKLEATIQKQEAIISEIREQNSKMKTFEERLEKYETLLTELTEERAWQSEDIQKLKLKELEQFPSKINALPGIYENLDISALLLSGWVKIYDKPYSHPTTTSELEDVKFQCNSKSVICIGGEHKDRPNRLVLCAIDDANNALEPTISTIDAKKSKNDVCWYCKDGYAFGFSAESNINLALPDVLPGQKRLSWRLTGAGGFRLGEEKNEDVLKFNKIILVKF